MANVERIFARTKYITVNAMNKEGERTKLSGGEASPALFWKSKKVPWLSEKMPWLCIHLWIKFTIQNAALRVSRRKTSKTGLFLCVFEKYLLNCPKSTKPLLPWKFSGCPSTRLCMTHIRETETNYKY